MKLSMSAVALALVAAIAPVALVGQASAAPSAFILTVSNMTTTSYNVVVKQLDDVRSFTLAKGHQSERLSLKIASASLSIQGSNCAFFTALSPQNTLTFDIREVGGKCKVQVSGTTNGF